MCVLADDFVTNFLKIKRRRVDVTATTHDTTDCVVLYILYLNRSKINFQLFLSTLSHFIHTQDRST